MKTKQHRISWIIAALCVCLLLSTTVTAAGGTTNAGLSQTNSAFALFVKDKVINEKNIRPQSVYDAALEQGFEVTLEETAKMIDQQILSHGSQIYTETGEYIQTYSMLNKRINEISFAGTHNSYSNNVDGSGYTYLFYGGTQNHDLGIKETLERGIRYVEVDVGNDGWLGKGVACYHRIPALGKTSAASVAQAIKSFLDENPNEFVYLRICEGFEGGLSFSNVDPSSEEYRNLVYKFMEELRKEGLLKQVNNYYGSQESVDVDAMMKPGKSYQGKTMEQWPTLKEMIQSDKRLIVDAYVINSTVAQAEPPANQEHGNMFEVASKMGGDENAIVILSQCADHGSTAGWRACSVINGDGRRAYEQMKYFENTPNALGRRNVTNVVMIDFFYGAERKGGNPLCDVDIVDAVNRMNLEREGAWSKSIGSLYWTTDPITEKDPEPIQVFDESSGAEISALSDGRLWQTVESASESGQLSYIVKTGEKINPYAFSINFMPWNGKDHVVPENYQVYYKNENGEFVLLGQATPHDHNQSWNVLQFEESSVMADEFKVVVNGKKGKWFVVTEMDLYASEEN